MSTGFPPGYPSQPRGPASPTRGIPPAEPPELDAGPPSRGIGPGSWIYRCMKVAVYFAGIGVAVLLGAVGAQWFGGVPDQGRAIEAAVAPTPSSVTLAPEPERPTAPPAQVAANPTGLDQKFETLIDVLLTRLQAPGPNAPSSAAPDTTTGASSREIEALKAGMKELLDRLQGAQTDVKETLGKVDAGFTDSARRLTDIGAILDNYRKGDVAEPADVLIVALDSTAFPFAGYKAACESALFDQLGRFEYSTHRLGLCVARSARVDVIVPLIARSADLPRQRDRLRAINDVPLQVTEDVGAALEKAQEAFEAAKASSGTFAPRRCVLIVPSIALPPQPDFQPKAGWKDLRVDVVMLEVGPKSADLGAWVDFCSARGGSFRLVRPGPSSSPTAPAPDGGASAKPPIDPNLTALVGPLKAELERLTQPTLVINKK